MRKVDRNGEVNVNNYGSKMTIVEYKNNRDITVEFENGYRTNTQYNHFKKGNVQNVYDKSIYDIGYIGEGEYKQSINGKRTIQYSYWQSMLQRCYDKNHLSKYPTYIGCEVCKEWHCFQTFAKWFDENYYECNGERMELDKDILCKGNKIYSPTNCVFVPSRINALFIKRQNLRGEYPIGVTYKNNKFYARCCILDGRKDLGYHNTPEKAFYVYKPFKEAYIKEVANDYKDKIPQNLYSAMMNYIVDITD